MNDYDELIGQNVTVLGITGEVSAVNHENHTVDVELGPHNRITVDWESVEPIA